MRPTTVPAGGWGRGEWGGRVRGFPPEPSLSGSERGPHQAAGAARGGGAEAAAREAARFGLLFGGALRPHGTRPLRLQSEPHRDLGRLRLQETGDGAENLSILRGLPTPAGFTRKT